MFCKKEPDRPDISIEAPVIESVNVNVKTQGKYKTSSGNPRGLVVHYTSGRSRKGREDAINTLNGLAVQGLGCFVMDCNGVIYRAQNQLLNDVAFHCGKSEWLGYKNISYQCMGMEICSAGQVDMVTDGISIKFRSWFNEFYYPDEVRFVGDYYHKFTQEQEDSLVRFCRWQKQVNPEFNFDWVVGHNEICVPMGRKSDPGGSLSCTMPSLRSILKASPKPKLIK